MHLKINLKNTMFRTSAIRQSTVPVELRYDELVKLCDMAMESFKQQKSLIWIEK